MMIEVKSLDLNSKSAAILAPVSRAERSRSRRAISCSCVACGLSAR